MPDHSNGSHLASLRQDEEARYRDLEQQIQADKERFHKEEQERCTEIARQRCTNMMIPLTQREEILVQNALDAEGKTVRGLTGCKHMLQSSMLSLKDGEWLGDEICSYMLKLLLEREQVMCNDNPTKKRSSFHPSFFYTKITNVGHLTESGTYKFENVVSWSGKGHEGDIFSLDKLFVPINQDERHWLVVVVFFDQKRIQVFDSLYVGNGSKESQDVFRYIQDEHRRKHGTELPQKEGWVILTSKETTPRQTNSELLNKCIHSIDASASHTYIILVLQHGTAACS
jgi:hypothetical protein